jgi:AcrR family transcriptional regulator
VRRPVSGAVRRRRADVLARRRQQQARSARERILTTADRLFYGNGVQAIGVQRLIEESQVTRVTFYRHFPSKDDLVLAYLDRRGPPRAPCWPSARVTFLYWAGGGHRLGRTVPGRPRPDRRPALSVILAGWPAGSAAAAACRRPWPRAGRPAGARCPRTEAPASSARTSSTAAGRCTASAATGAGA